MNGNTNTLILLDADVVIHFSKAGQISLLKQLYGKRLVILDVVVKELMKSASFRTETENILRFGIASEICLPINNKDIFYEYARLKKQFGDGESACMAYCRYSKDILASSNLRDIKHYCHEHRIMYLTTMDMLVEAHKLGLLTESACDEFIRSVKQQGSKLPVDTLHAYLLLKQSP